MRIVAGLFVVCIFGAANLGRAEEPSDENGIQFNKLLDKVEKNVAKAAKEEDQIQALVKEIQRLKKEAKEGEQKREEGEQKRAEEAKRLKTENARLKAQLRKASTNFKNLKSVKGLNNRAADASPSNNTSMNGTVRAASELTVVSLKAPGPIQYHWVKTKMTYPNARAYCKKNFNGDLASFPSDKGLKQIQKQVANVVSWVGGYCNKNDPKACEAAQETTGWRWVSGEPIPINAHGNTEWRAGEPIVSGVDYNLVFFAVAAGKAPLYATGGDNKFFFICSTTTS